MRPEELVELAIQQNLSGLSITDHDTVDAYDVALPLAREKGLKMISGVELSAVHNGFSVHILGYAFDLQSEVLQRFCQRHLERRLDRNRRILMRLNQYSMPVKEEELQQLPDEDLPRGKRTIGRPHIAMAMMRHGYVSSVDEAFKRYLGENKPCFEPGNSFSAEETIAVIKEAGGVAIIAHPHLIRRKRLVRQLLGLPFDGLEAYYARFHRSDEERWLQTAEQKNWIYTGGSDFHGTAKPHIQLGCSWVNEEVFQPLYERFLRNNSI